MLTGESNPETLKLDCVLTLLICCPWRDGLHLPPKFFRLIDGDLVIALPGRNVGLNLLAEFWVCPGTPVCDAFGGINPSMQDG